MWRKNSLGHWMRTFSNTPSTVSNLPLLLLLLLLFFSCSVVSNSLRSHGLKNYRLPCSSPSPGVCSSSCLLSWWGHPTISSSFIPFFSCLQSFPASGSFLMNQHFMSGGQPTFIHAYPAFLSWCLRITKVNDSNLCLLVLLVNPSSQPKQWLKGRNYIHFPDEEAKIQRLRHKGK